MCPPDAGSSPHLLYRVLSLGLQGTEPRLLVRPRHQGNKQEVMVATFCESVFGVFQLVVWFGFGLGFLVFSFGGDFLSFFFLLCFSFFFLF